MEQDTLKRLEGRLNLWKAQKRQAAVTELVGLANQESVPLATVVALWLVVCSRKVHEVKIKVPLVLRETQDGWLSSMTLRLLEPTTVTGMSGMWLCKPDTLGQFQVMDGFLQSLENARSAVNALDLACPIWPEVSPLVVQWEFESPQSHGIDGGSAGCIIALGLIELFKGAHLIKPDHRLHNTIRSKKPFPFRHLTASAQIDAEGYLHPVDPEGLAAKEQATGMKAMTELILSRQQTRTVRIAAAATRRDFPCANLNEALLKISALLGEEPDIRVVQPHRWFRVVASLMFGIIVLWFVWLTALAYPISEWFIRHPTNPLVFAGRMPSTVGIDFKEKPEDCKFAVRLESITDYTWSTRTWGQLQRVRTPFAMSIGSMRLKPDPRDGVMLSGFGEMQYLHNLVMLPGPTTGLLGAENLSQLTHFVNKGSRLRDLRWLDRASNLKTLVLDSGYTELYPTWNLPSVENMIVRLPADQYSLSLQHCSNLRRLALRGDGIKSLNDLDRLPLIEEMILHLETLEPDGFDLRVSPVRRLELARCRYLHFFEVGRHFPLLQKLVLRGTSFAKLSALADARGLEELVIEGDTDLAVLDLTGVNNLKRLVITDSSIKQIIGLTSCVSLEKLEVRRCPLVGLPGLGEMSNLATLVIESTRVEEIESLQKLGELTSLTIQDTPVIRLPGIGNLTRLTQLMLSRTKVQSLEPLHRLNRLTTLNLRETLISEFPDVASSVELDIGSTPLHKKFPGNGGFKWEPQQNMGSANSSGRWVKSEATWWSSGYGTYSSSFYYTFTPVHTYTSTPKYSPSSIRTPTLQRILMKLIQLLQSEVSPPPVGYYVDNEGWEIVGETLPPPPYFETHSLIERWGLDSYVGSDLRGGTVGGSGGNWERSSPFVEIDADDKPQLKREP